MNHHVFEQPSAVLCPLHEKGDRLTPIGEADPAKGKGSAIVRDRDDYRGVEQQSFDFDNGRGTAATDDELVRTALASSIVEYTLAQR